MRRTIHMAIGALVLLTFGVGAEISTAAAQVEDAQADPTPTLSAAGHDARVSGALRCTEGETFTVQVTIGQDETGAQARGDVSGDCTGQLQGWMATAVVLADYPVLSPDTARMCWNVRTQLGVLTTDLEQRCGQVLLTAPDAPVGA